MAVFTQIYSDKDINAAREAGELITRKSHYEGEKEVHIRRTHVGMVVAEREANCYHDSDFYAVCYNPDSDTFTEVQFGTTRAWTYNNGCSVDATEEVKARYKEWCREKEEARRKWREEERRKEARRNGTDINKGDYVVVTKGRKTPIGVKGTVFWTGWDKWKHNTRRVGIKGDDGDTYWTAGSNVEPIND